MPFKELRSLDTGLANSYDTSDRSTSKRIYKSVAFIRCTTLNSLDQQDHIFISASTNKNTPRIYLIPYMSKFLCQKGALVIAQLDFDNLD